MGRLEVRCLSLSGMHTVVYQTLAGGAATPMRVWSEAAFDQIDLASFSSPRYLPQNWQFRGVALCQNLHARWPAAALRGRN